jgi:hypothetical protein
MWSFSLGVLMVSITNDSLLLTAIFGFSSGGCVILFGAPIGDWMDKNNRLKGKTCRPDSSTDPEETTPRHSDNSAAERSVSAALM